MSGIHAYLPFKGMSWSKSYLTFDDNWHLNVRKLNPLQTVARKFLGFYKDTTLKHLVKTWNDCQVVHGNVSPELTETLTTLWKKRYSEPIPLLTPETFFVGNSKIEDAEVIGIAQLFSDLNNTNLCGKILSKYYRPGDVILIEGIDSNRTIHCSENIQTSQLTPPTTVQGWEPIGYEALHNKVFNPLISVSNQLSSKASLALKLLKNVNFATDPHEFTFTILPEEGSQQGNTETSADANIEFHPQNNVIVWNALLNNVIESLVEAIELIAKQPSNNPETSPNTETSSLATPELDKFKQLYQSFLQSQKTSEDCATLIDSISHLFDKYNKLFHEGIYKTHWTEAQVAFFKTTWGIRQRSISNEIELNRNLGKRIFLCAGAAHFCPNKGIDDSEVMSTLKKHKFTIVLSNIKQNATYYSFKDLAQRYNSVYEEATKLI